MTGDPELVAQVRVDPTTAELAPRERAIVAYVQRMTRAPGELRAADVDTLRAVGLDERGVLQVVTIAGFFNYVNRVADALGVGRDTAPGARGTVDSHG